MMRYGEQFTPAVNGGILFLKKDSFLVLAHSSQQTGFGLTPIASSD